MPAFTFKNSCTTEGSHRHNMAELQRDWRINMRLNNLTQVAQKAAILIFSRAAAYSKIRAHHFWKTEDILRGNQSASSRIQSSSTPFGQEHFCQLFSIWHILYLIYLDWVYAANYGCKCSPYRIALSQQESTDS